MSLITAISQICIVTKDFDRTIRFMTSVLGIGPFKVWDFDHPVLFNQTSEGLPAKWTMRLGVALIGNTQWEIIQPSIGPSLYSEFLEKHGDGPHHILFETKGTPLSKAVKYLEGKGFINQQSAMLNIPIQLGAITFPAMPTFLSGLSSLKFCYLESEKLPGVLSELVHLPFRLSTSTALRLAKADFFVPIENHDVMNRLPHAFIDKITKISFVTPDLSASIQAWERLLDITAWEIRENIAWNFIGDILLELIEPLSKDLAHEQLLIKYGPCITTIGVSTSLNLEQIVALMQSADVPLLMQGTDYKGCNFVRVDASKDAHVWLEITSMKNS